MRTFTEWYAEISSRKAGKTMLEALELFRPKARRLR